MKDWRSIVLLAFFRAFVSGVLAVLLTFCVFQLLELQNVWVWGCLVGCGVAFFTWVRGTEPEPERQTPVIVQEPEGFSLEIIYNDGAAGDFLTFGVTSDKFFSWCSGVAEGRSLAETVWTGARGLFSKGEYHQFRSELLVRGFLKPSGKSHSQGFELTGKGRALTSGVARTHAHASGTRTNDGRHFTGW